MSTEPNANANPDPNPNPNPNPGAGAGGGAGGDPNPNPGAGGAGSEPWYSSLGLDDETRQFVAGKGFQSAADAFKAHLSADKLVRDRNVLPAPDVNAINDWKGWEALGWTPDAAKYQVDLPEAAKGLDKSYEAFHQQLVQKLHANRVPLGAAKALAGEIAGYNARALADLDAQIAREKSELEAGLKAEWGARFDANRELAGRAMKTLGIGEADAGELDALMGSARMVKLFHKLGAAMGEDRLVTDKGGFGQSTVDQAKAQKAALEADPAKLMALRDPAHPQHKAVTEERERLQQIIFTAQRAA